MGKINLGSNVFMYPMPVVLVGVKTEEKVNFMTVGWITRINAAPPMLAMGINKGHYTAKNLEKAGVFSVNFPSTDMLADADYCGLKSGNKFDKSDVFKEIFYGELKDAPMIKACPLSIECRLVSVQELPANNMYVAEIVAGYSEDKYLTDGKVDIEKMQPLLLTMPDNKYWNIGKNVGKAWSDGLKRTAK